MRRIRLLSTVVIRMLLMACWLASASCHAKAEPVTVEREITSKDCRRALLEEHESLFAENIRLKAALKGCQESR